MRHIVILLAACGALTLAACGGDSTTTDTSGSGGGETTTRSTEDATTTPADGSTGPADPSVQAAIESCKQNVTNAPALADDVKADLIDLCDKAASGDEAEVKRISQEVCLRVIEDSGIPDGDIKDRAKEACNAID